MSHEREKLRADLWASVYAATLQGHRYPTTNEAIWAADEALKRFPVAVEQPQPLTDEGADR